MSLDEAVLVGRIWLGYCVIVSRTSKLDHGRNCGNDVIGGVSFVHVAKISSPMFDRARPSCRASLPYLTRPGTQGICVNVKHECRDDYSI